MESADPTKLRLFQPMKIITPRGGDLIKETTIRLDTDLMSYQVQYHFIFVNTMHMYLRIPINLFELYASEFNLPLDVVNFELPSSLLIEDVEAPEGFIPPEPGWSRYLQGVPHEQWAGFSSWLNNAKWMATDKEGNKILYGCEEEAILVRDPVKLQLRQLVGIKDFITISFFLPSNPAGRLYLNTKNGPPFHCTYVAKNGPGSGEALALFKQMRANP